MSINMNNDKNIPADAEACYETVASQEEIYIEETEEELRAILIFDDAPPSPDCSTLVENRGERELDLELERSTADANNDLCIAESLDQELSQAAEELITGDSDDPPLSDEAVVDMLRGVNPKESGGT